MISEKQLKSVICRDMVSKNMFYPYAKRTIDIFLATTLLIILCPLFIVVACLVKATSSGPIIFTQKRVGLNGKLFDIYKFRTMFTYAPRYGYHPTHKYDPRVTFIGRWLRRSSIDELPQLLNIIKGDMSFVGPRPEMPFIVEKYNEEQRKRLTVTPGLTGPWQISPDRAFPIHENIHHDLSYIQNRSLLFDTKIMISTPLALVFAKAK
jgi:lipopolysaccharide/colanic/teichoic acid biosynthesis glycosyltransferase